MALFLKDPLGNYVALCHIKCCEDVVRMTYLTELLINAGVRNFYAQPKAHWSGSSTKQKMRYHKLAAQWRRLGRHFSVEDGSFELRLSDCRKLVERRPSGRVGVLAFLLEINDAGRQHYVGYYGTLSELAGLDR